MPERFSHRKILRRSLQTLALSLALLGSGYIPPVKSQERFIQQQEYSTNTYYFAGPQLVAPLILYDSSKPLSEEELEKMITQMKEGYQYWEFLAADTTELQFSFSEPVLIPVPYDPTDIHGLDYETWLLPGLKELYPDRTGSSFDLIYHHLERTAEKSLQQGVPFHQTHSVVLAAGKDGYFGDNVQAHAYIGGPFMAIPLRRTDLSSTQESLRSVTLHEAGHIAGVQDQYGAAKVPCDTPGGYTQTPTRNSAHRTQDERDSFCTELYPVDFMRSIGIPDASAVSPTTRRQAGIWPNEHGYAETLGNLDQQITISDNGNVFGSVSLAPLRPPDFISEFHISSIAGISIKIADSIQPLNSARFSEDLQSVTFNENLPELSDPALLLNAAICVDIRYGPAGACDAELFLLSERYQVYLPLQAHVVLPPR